MKEERNTQTESQERIVLEAYRCMTCGAIDEAAYAEPLYKCGSCGMIFNRLNTSTLDNKCPNCGRFGSKIADYCCIYCEEGELEEIYAYKEYVECDEGG